STRGAPTTTSNPSLARRWAVAAPMPLDARVTTASPRFMGRRYRGRPARSPGRFLFHGGPFRLARELLDGRRGTAERLRHREDEEDAGDPPLVLREPIEHRLQRVLERLAEEPEEGEPHEDPGRQRRREHPRRHLPRPREEAH